MDATPKELFELSRKIDQMRKDVQQTNKELGELLEVLIGNESDILISKENHQQPDKKKKQSVIFTLR